MKLTNILLSAALTAFCFTAYAEPRVLCALASKESKPYHVMLNLPLVFTSQGENSAQAIVRFQFSTFPDLQTQLIVDETLGDKLKWTYQIITSDKDGRVLHRGWNRHQSDEPKVHKFRYQRRGYSVQCDAFYRFDDESTTLDERARLRMQLLGGDPLRRNYTNSDSGTEQAIDYYELYNQLLRLKTPQSELLRQLVDELNSDGYLKYFFTLPDFQIGSGAGGRILEGGCRSPLISSQHTCKALYLYQSYILPKEQIGSDGEPALTVVLEVEIQRDRATRFIRSYFIRKMLLNYEEVPPKGNASSSGGRVK